MLEALSQEFRTGTPRELLYADNLVISAGHETELRNRLGRWKRELENKGLRVNVGKTILISDCNAGTLKDSGKYSVVCVGKALVAIPFTAKAAYIGCIKNAVE